MNDLLRRLFGFKCRDWRTLRNLERCAIPDFETWDSILRDKAHPWTGLPMFVRGVAQYRVCLKCGNVDWEYIDPNLRMHGSKWEFGYRESKCPHRHNLFKHYAAMTHALLEEGRTYLMVERWKCSRCWLQYYPESKKCPHCWAPRNEGTRHARKYIIMGDFREGPTV